MEHFVKFQKLCLVEGRRHVLVMGMVAITYIMLQSLVLPYGIALKSMLPDNKILLSDETGIRLSQLSFESEKKSEIDPLTFGRYQSNSDVLIGRDNVLDEVVGKVQDTIVASEGKVEDEALGITKEGVSDSLSLVGEGKQDDQSNTAMFVGSHAGLQGRDTSVQGDVALERKIQDEALRSTDNNGNENESSTQESADLVTKNSSISKSDNAGHIEQIVGLELQGSSERSLELNGSPSSDETQNGENWNQGDSALPEAEDLPDSDLANELNMIRTHCIKFRDDGKPPITVTPIDKMNQMLAQHLASSSSLKPKWSSLHARDKEILDAKSKIIYSAASNVDKELYGPVFRNVSMFMRSYQLMEQTLKVYVYRDGTRPIFHQPILKGLYASEGWFMKLMEANKQFAIKKPERAHLFYMPFSSRELEHALYIPSSHNHTSLRQFVKHYRETLAAKYPFWNRTGGTDHFLVACHDWAPFETMEHMKKSIKALCNADVTIGFRIGRDVSLPETFIRYARNPLRYRGGKLPRERNILAFFAGNSHGYLRSILLKHWKGKDPAMRIYGVLPLSVSRKMNYLQHMKSSKYCICPKGFEVNSPRVVEAIFYECVPVIISDNFVPPFFEVLNWEAFSVIVPEKDIPNLKNILLSIPEKKYIQLQLGVRKVQQHFLWHARPVKYDLFHMILHSIWFSRVFQT